MLKAIIIDDELWSRKVIRKFGKWKELGIEVVGEAEDGNSGIELIEKEKPDIILTDMQMPNLDGIGLLKYIMMHHKKMKIIVISGYERFDYMKQAIASRAVEYLLKPIDGGELNRVLEQCVAELSLDLKVLSVENLFDLQKKEGVKERVAELKMGIQQLDLEPMRKSLEGLEKIFSEPEKAGKISTSIVHDFLVTILFEELEWISQEQEEIRSAFIDLDARAKESLHLGEYFHDFQATLDRVIAERKEAIESQSKPLAQLAHEYISRFYKTEISLQTVAAQLYTSKEYLSSLFKAKYQETVNQYILRLKMEEAVRLLKHGIRHQVVSEEIGYTEVSYFYKVFKKYYGCTPSEYPTEK